MSGTSKALVDSLAAERGGKLDDSRAIVEGARRGAAGAAAAVLGAVASRLALAVGGAPAALDAAAVSAPPEAWSARAALHLATAAGHLRVHTPAALEPARAAIAAALALIGDGAPDGIDELTAAAVAGAGDAARFVLRGSLLSAAFELRGIADARAGEIRAALVNFEAAYRSGEGDPDRRARVLLAWGLQLRSWGLFDEALRKVERSLELRLQLGDRHGAAICHGVIAFVHQRRGDHAAERAALAADLRLCEEIGAGGDIPGLRARLAGALVGLGKYAAAFAEAEAAIASDDPRVRGFAHREQARVRLGEGRHHDADAVLDRAAAALVADPYAVALCELTRAEIALARGDAAAVRAARDRAAPVFARLGALVEAAQLTMVDCEAHGDARPILERVVPALIEAGAGDTPLAHRARELAARLDPTAVRDDVVARAARLPALAKRILGD